MWKDLHEGILGEFAEAGMVVRDPLVEAFGTDENDRAGRRASRYAGCRVYGGPMGEQKSETRKAGQLASAKRAALQRKRILLKSGVMPGKWTADWRQAAADVGIEAPPQDAAMHEHDVQKKVRALRAGERPARYWGPLWREAAKRVGIEAPPPRLRAL